MITKHILPIILLLLSCLLWSPQTVVSAQEKMAAAPQEQIPPAAKAEEYASVARIATAANIRSEPSLSAGVLLAVPPGYPLAVHERRGDWVLVEDFMERKGWVYASLLTKPGTAVIKVWKGNLRTGPTLTAGIITKLDHGTLLSVVAAKGDWLQVNSFDGVSGWLHRDVVWPSNITVPARGTEVISETEPGRKLLLTGHTGKDIKPVMVKEKVRGTGMPVKAEKTPAPPATQEETPKAAKASEDAGKTKTANAANSSSGVSVVSQAPAAAPSPGMAIEFSGHISIEGRLFANPPLYPDQARNNASLELAPEFYHAWDSGSSLTFVPFFRLDSADSERTHFDIRELNFLYLGNPWELRIGIGKIFWGVTEFVHLVDIINQTDLVENIRGEDKLGQPMIHLSVPSDLGVLDFFVLPYFRERTFPGKDGRLRSEFVVDTNNPIYESGDEEKHIDFAVRYSRVFDIGDIGIYYFRGTSRDPLFIPATNASGHPVLRPYYQLMDQVGTDLQMVTGNWLWKLEALYQDNETKSYAAATGGFEYTFYGLGGSMMDLGLIAEFAYDNRNDEATTPFAKDLFLGLRLGANDPAGSELLIGVSYDLDNSSNVLQLEASRRLSNNLKIALEGWAFFNTEPDDFYLYSIRDDDFVRLQLIYYF